MSHTTVTVKVLLILVTVRVLPIEVTVMVLPIEVTVLNGVTYLGNSKGFTY